MIGSTREGSRVFFNDEVDIHLSLSHGLKQLCFFDVKEQALKMHDAKIAEAEVKKYFDARNVFKTEQYFHDFVAYVNSIIATLVLPSDFCMLPLTVSFFPCTRCMTTGLRGLQVMRCRHKPDCEHHKRCRCEEPNK